MKQVFERFSPHLTIQGDIMYQGQDPLRQALNQFEAFGCQVNYPKLTISGYSKQYLKNTEIGMFGEIDEDLGVFIMSCTTHTAHPFSEEAQIFLKQMEDKLAPTCDVRFEWSLPNIFSVIFVKEQLSSYNTFPEFTLEEALHKHFMDSHRFALSCGFIINQFGRMKQRYGTKRLPRKMNSTGLVSFCMADLADVRTGH